MPNYSCEDDKQGRRQRLCSTTTTFIPIGFILARKGKPHVQGALSLEKMLLFELLTLFWPSEEEAAGASGTSSSGASPG